MDIKREGVLILYNIPRKEKDGGRSAFLESDEGVLIEVNAVETALKELGIRHRKAGVSYLSDVYPAICGNSERIIFNLVEYLEGSSHDENFVPAVCRANGRACTGNTSTCLNICFDKWLTKALLQIRGVPTPKSFIVPQEDEAEPEKFTGGPYIVKPIRADGSEGIDVSSVVDGHGEALLEAIRKVHKDFNQPALVEDYIDGREINVSMIECDGKVEILPIAEIDFSNFPKDKLRIVGYSAKWLKSTFEYRNTPFKIPAKLPEKTEELVRKYSLLAWEATGCQDYARVDFRISKNGKPYVLEVNPNPDISPDAGLFGALSSIGLGYAEFVENVVSNALGRLRETENLHQPKGQQKSTKHGITVRKTIEEDREAIMKAIVNTDFFRHNEVAVALEVLDDSLKSGENGEYQSYTAEVEGKVAGWVCFGHTPCTVATYDLYWIVVSPDFQGKGVGKALMEHAEKLIEEAGGKIIVVETSGRPVYNPTRQFYLKLGYKEETRLSDFYAENDDKVIYIKRF